LAYVTVRNVSRVNFALYRMPVDHFLQANGEDWWGYWDDYRGSGENIIREWTLDVNPPLNQRRTYGTNLAEGEETLLDPGIYYLEVWTDPSAVYAEAQSSFPDSVERTMLVLSRRNLSVKTSATGPLVWATDLRSGDVLADVPIVLMDDKGEILAQGKADQDGVFLATGDRFPEMDQYDPVFAFVGDPENPGLDFCLITSQWSDGVSPWEFDLPVESYREGYTAYFLPAGADGLF
jgi:uncharacterized protein YfaS (alpha-2-macroglobulin family)